MTPDTTRIESAAESALHDVPPATGSPTPTRQPRGLYTLFMTEMWERFSYYGMKAQLALFLIAATSAGGLGWTKEEAGTLLAWYTGLVYLAPMIGGYLADRYLGTARCLIIGGIIIACGHFAMLMDTRPALFVGLALVVVGTGFFKSNVSTMVGQLYHSGDARRDSGFTIFYMGINTGAFLAPLICGWLQVYIGNKAGVSWGWRAGFAAAGVGMVFGLIQFLLARHKHLQGIGLPPAPKPRTRDSAPAVALTREERHRIAAIFIIAFFVIFFFSAFEQSGTSMAFFAQEKTDRSLPTGLNWLVGESSSATAQFPAGWFQSVNPLLILLLAPIFASMWVRLARRKVEPSTPIKMGVGLIILGLGFLFMVAAGAQSDSGRLALPWLLAAALFVHTCAELCLSPVGLSMVTKLAPLRFASLLMGVWFLAAFAGNFVAGKAAAQVDSFKPGHGFWMGGMTGFYWMFVIGPIVAGVILLLVARPLRRMMHSLA